MRHGSILSLVLAASLSACTTTSRNRVEGSPSSADIYTQMGIQYLELGRTDIALQNLQRALELDPRQSKAHNTIAVLYERLGKLAKAREHYEQAIDLDSKNPSIHNNYGQFLCTQAEYAEAQRHFQRAYEAPLYKRAWVPLTNAGSCALREGDDAKAEGFFRQALEDNPKFAPALSEMLTLSFKQQHYFRVRAFLQRYLEVAEHRPETLWIGIQAEKKLGNLDAVASYILLLRNKFPDSKEAAAAREAFPEYFGG